MLALGGGIGFATAIGVQPLIGYTDGTHLVPALLGLGLFGVGLWGSYRGTSSQQLSRSKAEIKNSKALA